jgi:hypothetical protein
MLANEPTAIGTGLAPSSVAADLYVPCQFFAADDQSDYSRSGASSTL